MSALTLKGMPFTRQDLAEATRHAYDQARRKRRGVVRHITGSRGRVPFPVSRDGKGITWSEARRRGYLWLLIQHFPQHMKRARA